MVLCGGSGLYIDAVLQGYRFKFQEDSQILSDPVPSAIIGLRGDRDRIRERITRRLQARLKEGMVEEVQALLDEGIPAERLIRFGLEYKYVTLYLTGELHYGDMVSLLNTAIHQFSKRQMTWFRRMERMGFRIHWVDADLPVEEKFSKIHASLREEGIDC